MSDNSLDRFAGQKYIDLETFRKSGKGVITPVWFAEDGGRLYVYTLADSGKVKRIRNNSRVRVALCDFRGKLKGDWVEARARLGDSEEARRANQLLDRKYFFKKIFNFTSKLRKTPRAVIVIEPEK